MGVVNVPPPPGRGVRGRRDGLLFKVLHVQITHNGGNWGPHCSSMDLLVELTLVQEVCTVQTQTE